MYLALGKTTPWTNESAPPNPDPNTNILSEVVGYKKVSKTNLCRAYIEGDEAKYPTVSYGSRKFTLIPDEDGYKEQAWMVYVEAEVTGDELPLGTFRQVGIHTDVVTKAGAGEQKAFTPNEITDTGILQFFENRQQQNRTADVILKEKFIITMENRKSVI
nr:MAG TPA: Baseplate wedge protein [Herelleviridae sp.]